ncbi:hypothetical protein CCAE64S_02047 [Castellaniella caeni]
MTPPNPPVAPRDRRLMIELLRLRADYERAALCRSVCHLAGQLRPQALASQATEQLRATGLGWVGLGWRAVRRYPMLWSLASSLVLKPGRRGLAAKAALAVGLVWLLRRQNTPPSDD